MHTCVFLCAEHAQRDTTSISFTQRNKEVRGNMGIGHENIKATLVSYLSGNVRFSLFNRKIYQNVCFFFPLRRCSVLTWRCSSVWSESNVQLQSAGRWFRTTAFWLDCVGRRWFDSAPPAPQHNHSVGEASGLFEFPGPSCCRMCFWTHWEVWCPWACTHASVSPDYDTVISDGSN